MMKRQLTDYLAAPLLGTTEPLRKFQVSLPPFGAMTSPPPCPFCCSVPFYYQNVRICWPCRRRHWRRRKGAKR